MKKNVDIKRQQKHARRMSSRLLCRPFSRYSTRSLSPHLSHHRRLTVLVSGRPLRCFSLSPVMVSRLPSLCLTCRLPLSHLSSPSINSNYKKKKRTSFEIKELLQNDQKYILQNGFKLFTITIHPHIIGGLLLKF